LRLLLVITRCKEGWNRERIVGEKRRRVQRAAHLLLNDGDFDLAETEAIVLFRNADAGPAHVGHQLLPDRSVEVRIALDYAA
jgi:hypothetical protein